MHPEKDWDCWIFADKKEGEKTKILNKMVSMHLEQRHNANSDADECAICGCITTFVSKMTVRHVCSDECMYKENDWIQDTIGEAIVFSEEEKET